MVRDGGLPFSYRGSRIRLNVYESIGLRLGGLLGAGHGLGRVRSKSR